MVPFPRDLRRRTGGAMRGNRRDLQGDWREYALFAIEGAERNPGICLPPGL